MNPGIHFLNFLSHLNLCIGDVFFSADTDYPQIWKICENKVPDEVVARHGPYALTAGDFSSLKGISWITDQVINDYPTIFFQHSI